MEIVANALHGNVPKIPFIKILNLNGTVRFYGREDGIWTDKELLNSKCIITSGEDYLICHLLSK